MSSAPLIPNHLHPVPPPENGDQGASVKGRNRTAWTADELMAAEFPEPRWAVPGILSEGVNLLAGPPKVGKSWLSLGLGLSVASGGMAMDTVPVEGGPVLYLALEDTPRRLQSRMGKLLGGQPAPSALTLATTCPPLPQGGNEAICQWLDRNPEARMVVIDVFAKMRGPSNPGASAYDADYAAVGHAKRIADHYGIAVVLVHHVRKAGSDDFLTEVSGTNGLAGAADATLVLKRARGQADGVLHVTGRDVDEAEYALQFHAAAGAWQMLEGPATDHTVGDTRAAILRHVRRNPGSRPKDIAPSLPDTSEDTIRRTCSRMVTDGQLTKDSSGRYYPPTETGQGQDTPELSHLSDCPETPTDQQEQPGQHPDSAVRLSDRKPEGGERLA
ncbi:AAA family ATPase [Streptomyces sp. CA-250714]|uniref:AAA family ATPase n=1 Tax=Streptomyces sp. CA-250714 TaxID=3240060 RepID=UPI003D8B9015